MANEHNSGDVMMRGCYPAVASPALAWQREQTGPVVAPVRARRRGRLS
jgi:hypothetical protein